MCMLASGSLAAAVCDCCNACVSNICQVGSRRGVLVTPPIAMCLFDKQTVWCVAACRCKMSTYIQGEPGDWCLLAKDDTITGTTATYCSQFPPYSFARVS